jgi:hypothetical protein
MPISQAPRLNTSFFYAEFQSKRYVCTIPADLKFEEVLKPSFWTHVGSMLKPWDRIEVRPDDVSFIAELVVVDAGQMYAKVALLEKKVLDAIVSDADEMTIDPPINGKFRVRRGQDVVKDGLPTKKDAQRWIDDYKAGAKAA